MSTIGTVSYLFAVWGLIFRLVFGRPLTHRIRKLEKKERKLVAQLKAVSDSFVPANLPFSHAGWVLLCISNGTCRVAARAYRRQIVDGRRTEFVRAKVNAHTLYRLCYDAYGFFGAEGAFEPLTNLCKEQWQLLKLDRDKFVATESIDPVSIADVEVVETLG